MQTKQQERMHSLSVVDGQSNQPPTSKSYGSPPHSSLHRRTQTSPRHYRDSYRDSCLSLLIMAPCEVRAFVNQSQLAQPSVARLTFWSHGAGSTCHFHFSETHSLTRNIFREEGLYLGSCYEGVRGVLVFLFLHF